MNEKFAKFYVERTPPLIGFGSNWVETGLEPDHHVKLLDPSQISFFFFQDHEEMKGQIISTVFSMVSSASLVFLIVFFACYLSSFLSSGDLQLS